MMGVSVWWIVSAVLVALELVSGTFYLLMLALGTVSAALAELLGASTTTQLGLATAVGLSSVFACHYYRRRFPAEPVASANPNVAQDVGSWVQVDTWLPGGCAKVQHRGAQWDAQAESTYKNPDSRPLQDLKPGRYRIRQVVGICLILEV